jgi:hypothetical protein
VVDPAAPAAGTVEDVRGRYRMGYEDVTCWVVQGGPRGRHVGTFVSSGIASVGWELDGLGDLSTTEDAAIFLDLEAAGRRKPADDLRDLRIFTDRMADGDVIVTIDSGQGDLLFGQVAGPYAYTPTGGPHRHQRPVRWFGRLAEDRAEDFLLRSATTRQLIRRLPEQLHWQRLAGEVEDLIGRPVDDVALRTARTATVRRGGTAAPRRTAAAKPAPVLTPDKLCPSCGLLRAPSMFPDGDEWCRDCA